MEQESAEQPASFYQSSFDSLWDNGLAGDEAPVHLGNSTPEPEQPILPDNLERELRIRAEGYAVYCFAKDNPEKNCFRRYIITYQPSLWDRYTVSRQWGRIGSERQQYRDEHFPGPYPALARIRRLISRRLKRGYQLINLI